MEGNFTEDDIKEVTGQIVAGLAGHCMDFGIFLQGASA